MAGNTIPPLVHNSILFLNFLLLNPQFPRTLSLPATAWKVYRKKQYLWLQDKNTWQEQFARFNPPFVDVPLYRRRPSTSIKCNPHNKIHRNRRTELWIVTLPYFTGNANVLSDSLRPCTRAYLVSARWFPVVFLVAVVDSMLYMLTFVCVDCGKIM